MPSPKKVSGSANRTKPIVPAVPDHNKLFDSKEQKPRQPSSVSYPAATPAKPRGCPINFLAIPELTGADHSVQQQAPKHNYFATHVQSRAAGPHAATDPAQGSLPPHIQGSGQQNKSTSAAKPLSEPSRKPVAQNLAISGFQSAFKVHDVPYLHFYPNPAPALPNHKEQLLTTWRYASGQFLIMVDDRSIGFVFPQPLIEAWKDIVRPLSAFRRILDQNPQVVPKVVLQFPAGTYMPENYQRQWLTKTRDAQPRTISIWIVISKVNSTLTINASNPDLLVRCFKPLTRVYNDTGTVRARKQEIAINPDPKSQDKDVIYFTHGVHAANNNLRCATHVVNFSASRWSVLYI